MSRWLFGLGKGGPLGSTCAGTLPATSGSGKVGLPSIVVPVSRIPVWAKTNWNSSTTGPGDPDHQFLVGDARLEVGIDEVLRAGVADAAVDDGDLAVVAQVHARATLPEEGHAQRLVGLDAGSAQLRAAFRRI